MLKYVFPLFLLITPARADEQPQAIVTHIVQENSPQGSIAGTGTFSPYNDVVLKAKTEGHIETIHFKEGEHVTSNQKLISFHNKEQLAKVKKAEASLKLSQNMLHRKQVLFKKNFVSHQDLEKAEAQVRIDEAELALTKENLGKTEVTAPFDGVLSCRKVSKGSCVIQGDELVRIQDLTPIRLVFHVPQKEISYIKVGDKVEASTDVYPDKIFAGMVEAVEPSVDEKSRSVSVFATFANADKLLIPGIYGHVRLALSSRSKPSLFLPEQTLVIRPDGFYVYKVNDSKAFLSKISIGKRLNDQVEVLSGLSTGDVIVLEGQKKLHEGSLVTTQTQS